MKLAWRLARRDLKGGLGGLGLLWLCLAVAIAGLASVTSLASSVDRAIAAQGRTLIGGDLLLSVAQREASADEQAAIRALGRSAKSVGLRAMLVAPGGESMLADLTGADEAWPLAGKLALAPGGRRPANSGEVAIGSAAAERLSLRVGDKFRLGRAEFTLAGIIESSPREGGFAMSPPALVDEAGLARTGLIQPGSLSWTAYQILLPAGQDPNAAGLGFQRRFAEGGWRATDRSEGGSGTRRFVDRLGQMLLLVALAALAIGGLGMASAAAAFAASRRQSIAILKLVGAPRATINAMLLVELGLVAGLAILAGLAVGAATPALVASISAPLLAVAPDPNPQWGALGEAALFGVLITFAASWGAIASASETRPAQLLRGDVGGSAPLALRQRIWPLLALGAAAALTIASATNHGFAASGIGVIAVLAALFAAIGEAIRRIARGLKHLGGPTTRLGIAALDRPGAATGRLAVALGLGLTLLIALAATASSILAEIDSSIPKRAPALFLVDIPRDEAKRVKRMAASELPGSELRLVPALRGPVIAVNGTRVADIRDIPEGAWILRGDRGLTFADELPPANRIVAGEWWPADYRGPPLVSIDVDAATALGLKIGDTLTVGVLGRPIEARIASFRQIDWRSMGFNFAMVFAPGAIDSAPYTLMATIAPGAAKSTAGFERRLVEELPMVSAVRVAEVVEQAKALLGSIDGAVRIATGFAIAMGMIVLAGSVVATRRERRRDIVLLRLVGATRGEVARSQLVEFSLLSAMVAVAALVLGVIAAWALVTFFFDFSFSPDWPWLVAIPAGAIFLAIGAALAAALPALNARPAEGLRAL
ncbi:MAG TPA: FtsX-like permease family protein [Sphingomicrobium sp.]|nr:FtsX-like permease family protein [Sphingomicrobium sp.]